MADEIQIRTAKPGDGALLAELNAPVQQLHVAHEPERFRADLDGHELATFFDNVVAQPGSRVVIARLAGRPAGYLWFEHQTNDRSALKEALSRLYVHQLSTLPQFRRRGVAKALMTRVIEYGESHAIQEIALDSWSFNEASHRFFESLGFGTYKINMRLSL